MQPNKKTYTTPQIDAITVFSDRLMENYASGGSGTDVQVTKGTSFDSWDDEEDEDDLEILSRSDKVLKLFEDSPYY